MLSAATLKTYTCKDLAQMAKQRDIAGWHSMRKDQLVRALVRASKTLGNGTANSKNGKSKKNNGAVASRRRKSSQRADKPASKTKRVVAAPAAKSDKTRGPKPRQTAAQRRVRRANAAREQMMDLATHLTGAKPVAPVDIKDRIVLMVRDSYWIQAYWELTPQLVLRARAALAEKWHSARPVLRVVELPQDNVTNTAEKITRVIEIHGAVKNWYIDVQNPPSSYRVEIGYLTVDDHFHTLARSNAVTTPRPGSGDMLDGNWAEVVKNSEKIYAMSGGYESGAKNGELQQLFEERLRRPMGSPMVTRFGNGAEAALQRERGLPFSVDAEMIIYGVTAPDAFLTLSGEPVKLAADGSFTARVTLPERRQVLPIVASSSDGVEERTIVLAVERNTKVMEAKLREPGD